MIPMKQLRQAARAVDKESLVTLKEYTVHSAYTAGLIGDIIKVDGEERKWRKGVTERGDFVATSTEKKEE
jgi:hypothetical protein